MPDETPSDDLPGQSGGLNIDGKTSIGGNAVGRDSITQTTTTTSNTTVNEGGAVARYAVIGVVVIAALAIVIIALLAFQGQPIVSPATPTASLTATLAPSLPPSATASPPPPPPTPTSTELPTATLTPPPTETVPSPSPTWPPTETPTPNPSPTEAGTLPPPTETLSTPTQPAVVVRTVTPTPSPTVTETASPTPTLTPSPTLALPLYDNFASSCLKKEKWMLDWVWQSPPPTPGAPVCLDTRPQFMAADGGLIVFLDATVDITKSVTHALTSAQLGYYKQVEVVFTLNSVDVFTDTRTTYLSAGVSFQLARPADADLEIRLQGSNATGKFSYQITSLLTLKDGSGNVSGGKLPYVPGQPVVAAFRVKGNKLTAYVNNQPMAGPFSILSEPSAVNIGYHADAQTSLDGTFDEVRILQMPASEIRPPTTPVSQDTPPASSARILATAPAPTPTPP
jgi:hypothetical protein